MMKLKQFFLTYQINLADILNASEAIYNPIFNGEKTEIAFKLEKCDCKRHLKEIYANPLDLIFNQTTCGLDAFNRGSVFSIKLTDSSDSNRQS